jgi:hypothetical protein
MVDEEGFIPGIFNYCDRWCERCAFTGRCRVFAMEQTSPPPPEANDIRNSAFWDHIGGIFEQTKQMLREMALERGIDLDAAMAEEAARPRPKKRPASAAQRAVLKRAKNYFPKVDTWFKTNKKVFKKRGLDLLKSARLGLEGADPQAEADDITDAVDVVRWYCMQIYVKLKRASLHEPEEDEDPDMAEAGQSDRNGSAKVALIGIDRSIAAWGRLYEQLPEAQSSILDVLVHLDRLRRGVEELFPHARSFIRPGFDEPA